MVFGFLKKLGKPPVAELTAYEDGVVHFRCSAPLAPGKRHNLMCKLPEGEDFGAMIEVMAYHEPSSTYTGYVDQPKDANRFLSMLLPVPFQDRRQAPRVRKKLRILSRDVPGYKCMTTDIGCAGFCTLVNGPIEPGSTLDLELDLDLSGVRPMKIQAKARWCASHEGERTFLVGCEFLQLTPFQRRTIEGFIEGQGELKT